MQHIWYLLQGLKGRQSTFNYITSARELNFYLQERFKCNPGLKVSLNVQVLIICDFEIYFQKPKLITFIVSFGG